MHTTATYKVSSFYAIHSRQDVYVQLQSYLRSLWHYECQGQPTPQFERAWTREHKICKASLLLVNWIWRGLHQWSFDSRQINTDTAIFEQLGSPLYHMVPPIILLIYYFHWIWKHISSWFPVKQHYSAKLQHRHFTKDAE